MKTISVKKKISIVLGSALILFALYIGFTVYQTNQMEIIPYENINELKVSTKSELQADTRITGTINVDKFEGLALVDQMVVEDTLYLIVYKWPTIIQSNKVDFTLENTEDLNKIKRISVVYGEIFSGEGYSRGISYNDLIAHPDQTIIWEKGGSMP